MWWLHFCIDKDFPLLLTDRGIAKKNRYLGIRLTSISCLLLEGYFLHNFRYAQASGEQIMNEYSPSFSIPFLWSINFISRIVATVFAIDTKGRELVIPTWVNAVVWDIVVWPIGRISLPRYFLSTWWILAFNHTENSTMHVTHWSFSLIDDLRS